MRRGVLLKVPPTAPPLFLGAKSWFEIRLANQSRPSPSNLAPVDAVISERRLRETRDRCHSGESPHSRFPSLRRGSLLSRAKLVLPYHHHLPLASPLSPAPAPARPAFQPRVCSFALQRPAESRLSLSVLTSRMSTIIYRKMWPMK